MKENYKEFQKNNNATLASYYKEYSEVLSWVIQRAKRMEHDKLILNSGNKVKTTWGIINEQSGRNKKRSDIQALKIEGKKKNILINKLLQNLLMNILLLSQKF